MKKMIFTLLLTTCQIVLGSQDVFRIHDEPLQYRVSFQSIEVPHTALTDMLSSNQKNGQTLHDKVMALTKTGQGKILESSMIVCRSGQRASVESILEVIYPTEYELPELIREPPLTAEERAMLPPAPPKHPALRQIYSFEPRNTGVTFEVEATGNHGGMVELYIAPEIVTQVGLETWMEHVDEWGDASIRMPIFECLKLSTSITLKSGTFEFVSALTPKSKERLVNASRKLMVFVKADVITNKP